MCDYIPGQLLACYRRDDPIGLQLIEDIRAGRHAPIGVLDTLSDRLAPLKLTARQGLQFDFVRLEVPPNEEVFKINILQFLYKERLVNAILQHKISQASHPQLFGSSTNHFQVGVNSYLTICATKSAVGKVDLRSGQHSNYKNMIRWTTSTGLSTKVLILDTGVYSESAFNVVAKKNFVDSSNPDDVTDKHNHGTAVVSIIEDLCPKLPVVIYKVADDDGKASEWDSGCSDGLGLRRPCREYQPCLRA